MKDGRTYLVSNQVIYSITYGPCHCISCYEKLKPIAKEKLDIAQIDRDDRATRECDICHTLLIKTTGITVQEFFCNIATTSVPADQSVQFHGLNVKFVNDIPILMASGFEF